MRTGRKLFWGILFLLAALAVIAGGMGALEGFSFWTILFTVGLIGFLMEGIYRRDFGGILFPLALLAILYDEQLGIEAITPWPVLGAAILGSIGLGILFPNVKRKKTYDGGSCCRNVEDNSLDGELVHYEVTFGEAVKYITSTELVDAHLECSFGNLNVYFNNAVLKIGEEGTREAEVHAECSFGSLALYVPADWKVVVRVSNSFAGVKELGSCNPNGENTLYIRGEVSFGVIEIHYI